MKLISVSSQENPFELVDRLLPLLSGHTVMLRIKERVEVEKPRVVKPIICISPVIGQKDFLLIALQGSRCEVVSGKEIRDADFIKIGLKLRAASKLSQAIRAVYRA